MSNVLMFSNTKNNKKESIFVRLLHFCKNVSEKHQVNYKLKLKILRLEAYYWYLRRILAKQKKENKVDFPEFIYWSREVVHSGAERMSFDAIRYAQTLGKCHIERCFKRLLRKKFERF